MSQAGRLRMAGGWPYRDYAAQSAPAAVLSSMAVLRAQTHPLSATEAYIARCGARYSGYMASPQTALGQAVRAQAAGPAVSWGYRAKAMAVEGGRQREGGGPSRDGISCSEERGIQEVMA